MADFIINQKPYFQILHAMFRPDKEPSPDYTDLVYEWYSKHTLLVEKVTSKAEWRVLCAVNGYYLEHKMALSREAINSVLTRDSQSKVLHEVMDQYDQYADELTLFHPDDLDTQLDQRKEEYEKYRLQRLFAIGSEIAINEYQLRDKEKTVLRGPESAIKYVLGEFQNGVLIDDRPAVGGTLASLAPGIKDRYEQAEQDREYNDLFIPTGMIAIDNHCGGLRRQDLVGVLGFVGNRKTCMVRTIGFNAAKAGFRVLHIPIETDVNEESDSYSILYVRHKTKFADNSFSKKRLERGLFTEEEKRVFFEKYVPQYQQSMAKNLIVYSPGASRTWADVKSIIDRENAKAPLDLVIIDYLTLLSTPGNRDEKADKVSIVQDVKNYALTANDGRGICILTPIQGSRKGYDEAGANDGAWATSGIYMYSELDKSLDVCYYVYKDDGLDAQGSLKIGSCKMRRNADLPTTIVAVDEQSGMVRNTISTAVQFHAETTAANNRTLNQDEKFLDTHIPVFGTLEIPD
jgi:hypothetical protein